jgi:BirA family biotin operon repressor/biotin-[acetyl-CoA-carboxylase] ligase
MNVPGEALRGAVAARGLEWPAPLYSLDLVDSTNSWLLERARAGVPFWTAVVARAQSAGRGRQGRRWSSDPGGLFMSVLCPAPRSEVLGLVGLATGTAVARAVKETSGSGDVRLKWPNDVLIDGRKVAGILAETRGSAARWGLVAGIGVNIMTLPDSGGDALPATSIAASGTAPPIETVAAAVLGHLRVCYDAVLRGDARRVVSDWRALSVAWWGRPVSLRDGGVVMQGRPVDVDEAGRLVVEMDHGERLALSSGDVTGVRLVGGER